MSRRCDSNPRRVAPDWDLWRTLYRLSYSAAVRYKVARRGQSITYHRLSRWRRRRRRFPVDSRLPRRSRRLRRRSRRSRRRCRRCRSPQTRRSRLRRPDLLRGLWVRIWFLIILTGELTTSWTQSLKNIFVVNFTLVQNLNWQLKSKFWGRVYITPKKYCDIGSR